MLLQILSFKLLITLKSNKCNNSKLFEKKKKLKKNKTKYKGIIIIIYEKSALLLHIFVPISAPSVSMH